MSRAVYIDTSALAKWYINQRGSGAVEKYIQRHAPVAISDLTVVEMRCLLARRRRDRSIPAAMEMEIFATFQEDIRQRFLVSYPLPEGLALGAVNLMTLLHGIPVRTLDALHLMIAKENSCDVLATSDHIMAEAAKILGLKVLRF